MKYIAWGNSKLLQLYLESKNTINFEYVIDNGNSATEVSGLAIYGEEKIQNEPKENICVIIFAVSNHSILAISKRLNNFGFIYQKNYLFYSDLFLEGFHQKISQELGWGGDLNLYKYSLTSNLNSKKPIHTTVLGTYLFLLSLKKTASIGGAIAEVGCFEGGNSSCALQYALAANLANQKYYLLDSFSGFPELTNFDPKSFSKGDYSPEESYANISNYFEIFNNAKIIKGFVPDSLSELPEEELYSLVFYDCDLYQPAVDTYNYFWPRLKKGGILLIHDYHVEKGGFVGVKKATDEFFEKFKIISFFENTMAMIIKE